MSQSLSSIPFTRWINPSCQEAWALNMQRSSALLVLSLQLSPYPSATRMHRSHSRRPGLAGDFVISTMWLFSPIPLPLVLSPQRFLTKSTLSTMQRKNSQQQVCTETKVKVDDCTHLQEAPRVPSPCYLVHPWRSSPQLPFFQPFLLSPDTTFGPFAFHLQIFTSKPSLLPHSSP